MATWILTPNQADPVTGLIVPVLGWHFTLATALDALEGANKVWNDAAWCYDIQPDTDVPTNQQMVLTKKGFPQLWVKDTQWFALVGTFVTVLDDDDVTNNYTVTQQEES